MNKTYRHPVVLHPQHPQMVEIPAPLEIHESVSSLAAELLLKVVEVLLSEPEQYDQNHSRHDCGAPCCIIGHMRKFAGSDKIHLTTNQFARIYDAEQWPEHIYTGIRNAGVRPSVAVARIEWFLKTGE